MNWLAIDWIALFTNELKYVKIQAEKYEELIHE